MEVEWKHLKLCFKNIEFGSLFFSTKFLLIENQVRHCNVCLILLLPVFPDCFVALLDIQNYISKEGFSFPACKMYIQHIFLFTFLGFVGS